MSGLVKIGVLLNLLGSVLSTLGISYHWPMWGAAFGVWASVWCGVCVLGAWYGLRDRARLSATLLILSGIALLPFGGLAIVAGRQTWQRFKFGLLIRRRHEGQLRPRPRAWVLGAGLLALVCVGALSFAIHQLYSARLVDLQAAIEIVSALLLGVLCGVLALLFVDNSPAAPRLGYALALLGIVGCTVAGFYLHSYIALALLGLPLYLLLLLVLGRERYKGLAAGKSPLGKRSASRA